MNPRMTRLSLAGTTALVAMGGMAAAQIRHHRHHAEQRGRRQLPDDL